MQVNGWVLRVRAQFSDTGDHQITVYPAAAKDKQVKVQAQFDTPNLVVTYYYHDTNSPPNVVWPLSAVLCCKARPGGVALAVGRSSPKTPKPQNPKTLMLENKKGTFVLHFMVNHFITKLAEN